MIYLPEYHCFEHLAIVPWPRSNLYIQQDWVEAIETLESWLEQYTGPHLVEWAFATHQEQQYWEACIAFRRAKNATLFRLAWAK